MMTDNSCAGEVVITLRWTSQHKRSEHVRGGDGCKAKSALLSRAQFKTRLNGCYEMVK